MVSLAVDIVLSLFQTGENNYRRRIAHVHALRIVVGILCRGIYRRVLDVHRTTVYVQRQMYGRNNERGAPTLASGDRLRWLSATHTGSKVENDNGKNNCEQRFHLFKFSALS